MLKFILPIILFTMSISILICFIRVLIGPTMSDRVMALDAMGINLIGIIGMIMILQKSLAYVDVILVLGILSFIGSIALAKFLERGIIIDRSSN